MAQRYGLWEIVTSLGEGGQGYTYRVTGPNNQRGVLKRLKNPKRGWRFQREIDALRQLQSKRIPRLLDNGADEKHVWIITEDCGESLPKCMERNPPFEMLVAWFCDIVQAVCDAHRAGIIHRDIKPNNIVINDDFSTAFLVDFGICQITDSGPPWTTSEEAFGNAAFAAPECFLGSVELPGPPCDVYSLGKVFYWMLSGGKHILREQLRGIEANILHPSKHVRARAVRLIGKAIVEVPTARCTTHELQIYSNALREYTRMLVDEAQAGIIRLIDNLGVDGNFNQGSSRHIASEELAEADIHPNIKMVGFPTRNCAQAERFENPYSQSVHLYNIVLGLHCTSLRGEVEILLVGERRGQPSAELFGRTKVNVEPMTPKLKSIDMLCVIPPGPFWVVLKASELSGLCVNIHNASNEVSPQPSTFAESFNGGRTWEVKTSPGGPGLAIRAYGKFIAT